MADIVKHTPGPVSAAPAVALTRLAIRTGGSGANVYAFTEADDDGDYVFYTEAKAALSAQDVARWHPIETAPKDGTDVLLSSPHWHGDVVVGCWSFEGWRDRDDSDKLAPTHWMPLPAAPETEEGRS